MTLPNMIQPINTYLRPTDTMEDAARVMPETRFDVLPVGDEQGRLIGVFSRSSLYRMILEKLPSHTAIAGFVKAEAVTTQLERLYHITFEELEHVIQNSQVGSGIIIDGEQRIVGVLTKSKVVNALVESKNDLREQLEALLQTAGRWEAAPKSESGRRVPDKSAARLFHQATYVWAHILTRNKGLKQVIAAAQKAARREAVRDGQLRLGAGAFAGSGVFWV